MDVVIAFLMLTSWMDSVSSLLAGGGLGHLLGDRRGLEGRVDALERMLNQNQNPIKAHNEFMNAVLESSI